MSDNAELNNIDPELLRKQNIEAIEIEINHINHVEKFLADSLDSAKTSKEQLRQILVLLKDPNIPTDKLDLARKPTLK